MTIAIKYSPLVPPEQQAYIESPIVMEDASGVAVGSVVLPGSIIGSYSWVGSGSVVRGRIPRGVIAGGSPAAVLKQRFGAPIAQDTEIGLMLEIRAAAEAGRVVPVRRCRARWSRTGSRGPFITVST